ncbi:MAG: WYL domain-containing protein [Desulfovibrio sp.]|nr:WYL domain-containing protein [Desulfovibrio sp.]
MGCKQADAKPAEKLLALFTTLLFNNRSYSLGTLAEMLDCSKQTVSRLLVQMEAARYGKLAREKQGREVFYRLLRPEHVPAVSLDGEGLAQLLLCRDFLAHLLPQKMQAQMQKSLEVAVSWLPRGSQKMPGSVAASLGKGHIDYAPFQGFLETLMRAIRGNAVCAVRYRRALDRPEKEYDYAPRRLVAYREGIFVLGYMVTDKGTALPLHDSPTPLALHRFTGCALTRRGAGEVPPVPPPTGGILGVMETGEPFEVLARFAPSAATYVAERQWSEGQQVTLCGDGSVLLRVRVANEPECVSWLLGFGAAAEVLEPAWLRERMAAELEGMLAKYAAR